MCSSDLTSQRRSSELPDIPTISEAGLPGYEIVAWFGVLAPAGTPPEIVSRLHAAVVKAVADPETRSYFVAQGLEPVTNSPTEFAAHIRAEIGKFQRVVRSAGIQPE